jgi:hypothetical protein
MKMHGAHVAIHASKQGIKKKQQEEEEMTKYRQNDLENDWEFKIVRSATGAFKKPQVLRRVIDEEALAGWKMVEKFDDSRIRFKRSADAAKKDHMLPLSIDPYRSYYGISEGALGATIGLSIGVILAIVITLISLAEKGIIF